MRNQKNRTPPHIKINCRMYHLFLTPYRSFMAAPSSSQPITRWKPCPRIRLRGGMWFPLATPLGSHIPLRPQIPGRAFRQTPQPETTIHSKGKFRDAASATPPIRKAHPTLDTSGYGIISHLLGIGSATWRPPGGALLYESHRVMRKEARIRLVAVLHLAIHPANARDCIIQNRLIIRMMEISPQTLATAHLRVKKKASRISRLSRLYYFEHTTAIIYSPSTAFLAAAAMMSRSSLVG